MGANAGTHARSMPLWTRVAAGVVLLAGGVAAGVMARGGRAASGSSPPVRLTIAPQPGVTPSFGETDNWPAAITISPDGRYVTFAAKEANASPMLWLRRLDALEAKPLMGTENGECPFWSPDSRSIAFFSDGHLKRIDVSGGPAVTLAAIQDNARGGSWNREGVILYAPNWQSAIVRVSANGGQPVPVTKLDPTKSETTHRWARFLPDGKHFLYTAGSAGHGAESELNAIYVASLDEPTPKLILRATSQAIYSDGHLLYMRGAELVAQPFDPDRLTTSGDVKVVAEGVHYVPGFFRGGFDVSDGGTIFYARARNMKCRLFWLDPDGRKIGPIGEPVRIGSTFALSPDETRIAVGIMDQRTSSPDIWLYDASSGAGIPFAADPTLFETHPVWSPDGTQVVFSAGIKWPDLALKSVAGGAARVLLESDAFKTPTAWSPDGDLVLFDQARDSTAKTEVWIVSTRGNPGAHKLIAAEANVFGARLSPDGRWILYTSDESGRDELYVQAFPIKGPRYVVSRNGIAGTGFWTRGGREIIYEGADSKAYAVAVQIKSGVPVLGPPVERGDLADVVEADVTPSGRLLLAFWEKDDNPTPFTILTDWTAVLK